MSNEKEQTKVLEIGIWSDLIPATARDLIGSFGILSDDKKHVEDILFQFPKPERFELTGVRIGDRTYDLRFRLTENFPEASDWSEEGVNIIAADVQDVHYHGGEYFIENVLKNGQNVCNVSDQYPTEGIKSEIKKLIKLEEACLNARGEDKKAKITLDAEDLAKGRYTSFPGIPDVYSIWEFYRLLIYDCKLLDVCECSSAYLKDDLSHFDDLPTSFAQACAMIMKKHGIKDYELKRNTNWGVSSEKKINNILKHQLQGGK